MEAKGYIQRLCKYFSGYSVPLYVKDAEVDALANRLADIKKLSKTEAVRLALKHELEREQARPSLVEIGLEYARALRARGAPEHGKPTDKAFIDSLYERS